MLHFIPNIITFFRLLLTVPVSISIYNGNEGLALILFIFAGLSDGFDGYLARKFRWESKLGKILDPLADKCLIVATLLALAFAQLLPIWLAALLIIRDGIAMTGAMLYLTVFEGKNTESNRWGKHYTGWTIALFILVLLKQTFQSQPYLIELLYQISIVGVLLFTGLSIFFYLKDQGKEVFDKLFID